MFNSCGTHALIAKGMELRIRKVLGNPHYYYFASEALITPGSHSLDDWNYLVSNRLTARVGSNPTPGSN